MNIKKVGLAANWSENLVLLVYLFDISLTTATVLRFDQLLNHFKKYTSLYYNSSRVLFFCCQ